MQHEQENIENLIDELKQLLLSHEFMLGEESRRRQVNILEQWAQAYQHDHSWENKDSLVQMQNLRDRLKLTADEMYRLEGEGGSPLNKEQGEKVEKLLKTVQQIEKIILRIDHMCHPAHAAA